MISKKIEEIEFVVFDLETTGLKASDEQIIEIAASKIKSGIEIEKFHKFIKLYKQDSLEPFTVKLTNITDALLEERGENISDVMAEFNEFIDGCVLVAQNAKFDMSFLIDYSLKENNAVFSPYHLDTIKIAKYLRPEEKSYKLSVLTEMFGVEYDADAHHRADYDVEITTKVFLKQLQELKVSLLMDLLKLEGYRPMSEKQESFLNSLISKNHFHVDEDTKFTINTASAHIDFFLNK